MKIRNLVPYIGESGTRKRWRKLKNDTVTLPVLFSLFFTKSVEIFVLAAPEFPMEELVNSATMLLLSIITGVSYIYGLELDIEDVVFDG
jgi:hypothetical protein